RPSSLFRRASALNCISLSWANLASKAFSRSSKVVMAIPGVRLVCSHMPTAGPRRKSKDPRSLPALRLPGAWTIGQGRKRGGAAAPVDHCSGEFMARRKKVYEGKAKILYEGPEPGTLIQYFKDDGARPVA